MHAPLIRSASERRCSSLSGCGWRLAGDLEAVGGDGRDVHRDRRSVHRFQSGAARESARFGRDLAGSPGDATAIVRILHDESGQRVLSVSAQKQARRIRSLLHVEYSVANEGGELIPPQKLELTRDYSYDETALLAKQREQGILREALDIARSSSQLRRCDGDWRRLQL